MCILDAMNELGLSSLYGLLELLNIPAIPASLTNITSNFIEQMARVKRILGQDIFFGFGIMPDVRNHSKNVMVLYPSELDSPFPRCARVSLYKLIKNNEERCMIRDF